MHAEDGRFMCGIWSLCGVLMMYGEALPGAQTKKSEHLALATRSRPKINYCPDDSLAELKTTCFL
jgi:hypothetical protein